MEVHTIPIEDEKFIIYRPLLQLAFIGNQEMADLAIELANDEYHQSVDMPEEVSDFLNGINFFRPDPPPPQRNQTFHPTTAVLLVTNRCNLRCTYCYADAGMPVPEDVSLELAQTVIDKVCQNAIDANQSRFELNFHGGGEPTQAWTMMKEATAYARSKPLSCHISVVSNGVWSPTQRDWLFENIDNINISFDGDQPTQDHQRPLASGEGSFKHVMETIRAMEAANIHYSIRLTATAPFRDKLPEDIRFFCEETNCQQLHVEPAFNIERGGHQEPRLEECEEFIEAFIEAFDIAKRAGRDFKYSSARPETITATFCGAPYNSLIVTPGGKLVTCYEVTNKIHHLANISTIGSIIDGQVLVNGESRYKLHKSFNDKWKSACKDCFCRWHCAGDCYARTTVMENGTPRILKNRCLINRQTTIHLLLWYIMANHGIWLGQTRQHQQRQHPQRQAVG
jgi:uncharacterized protein